MTLIQVWGCLLIFVLCPLLGGLPAAEWLSRRLGKPRHRFIQGVIEASKGIVSVLLARYYFPADPTWWLVALIALVYGQFWLRHSKQLLGVMAGGMVYSWQVGFLLVLMGGISLTLLREQRLGKIGLMVLFPIVVGLYSQDGSQGLAAIGLSCLLFWIDQQLPHSQPAAEEADPGALVIPRPNDAHLFRMFQRDRNIRTLEQPLNADPFGQPAAILSQLKSWGYSVPLGWVLPPGDDAEPLIRRLAPSPEQPLMVRSAVVSKQVNTSTHPSPDPVVQITSRRALSRVIGACRTAYSSTPATPNSPALGVAVMVQVQIHGLYGGLAWSQDLKADDPTMVLILGGPGQTPSEALSQTAVTHLQVPQTVSKNADVSALSAPNAMPADLVQQIAKTARDLETHYQGVPQKLEWTYDGTTLWLLEVTPISG